MNIDHQFPPSSPLLQSELELDDFKVKDAFDSVIKVDVSKERGILKEKDDAYLTPDPSSSLGDVTVVSDSLESDGLVENNTNSSPSKIEKRINIDTHEPTIKENEILHVNKKSKKSIIDSSCILNENNFQNVIRIPLNGDVVNIGRSGISCNFKLNSSNKLISRVHAKIQFEKSSGLVFLQCLGFNGLNVTIPKTVQVEKIKDKEFKISTNEIVETDDDDSSTTDSNSRILSKSLSFTNFYMLKDELIKMPIIEGTVIDFRGELTLIVYENDNYFNSTSTKIPAENKTTLPSKKLSIDDLTKIVKDKKLQFSTHPTLDELKNNNNNHNNNNNNNKNDKLISMNSGARPIEKNNLVNTIIYKRSSPSPSPSPSSNTNTIPINSDFDSVKLANKLIEKRKLKNIEISTIDKKVESFKNNENNFDSKSIMKREPLKEINDINQIGSIKQENNLNKSFNNIKQDTNKKLENEKTFETKDDNLSIEEQKKRGRPKKAKKTEEEILRSMPTEEIEEILSTVPELDNISNLVTNHIAYSRVLQTPFSSIRELNSIKKHELSKLQLRCVLIHNINCIGVIFRQGKDAAGKQLDEEYYYIPEKDSDISRVQLVEELKGSSSHLRSCRKTHKQYFWKKPKI